MQKIRGLLLSGRIGKKHLPKRILLHGLVVKWNRLVSLIGNIVSFGNLLRGLITSDDKVGSDSCAHSKCDLFLPELGLTGVMHLR